MRELIEDQWSELVHKLPPKRAAELIILVARENQSLGDIRRPDPPLAEETGGSGLVTTHGDYRRVVTN
jgi:hypothetical protein